MDDTEILSHLRCAVIVIDELGTIVRATGAAEGISGGHDLADLVGLDAIDFVGPEHVERMERLFEDAPDGQSRRFPAPFPIPLVGIDGEVETIECLATGVSSAEGKYWIFTLTPREIQSFAATAFDEYVDGGDGLSVAARVAQRVSATSTDDIRVEALVLHDVVDDCFTHVFSADSASVLVDSVRAAIDAADAPWNSTTAEHTVVEFAQLPESVAAAAATDGFVIANLSVVYLEGDKQLAFLMFVNHGQGFDIEVPLVLDPAIRILQGALARSRAEEILEHAAQRDALTGLANRRSFTDAFDHPTLRGSMAVLFIDVDQFKRINDTHGHAAGDAVLVETARRITAVCRPGDVVARFGGDEFAVLLANVDAAAAEQIGERIAARVAEPLPSGIGPDHVTASVGLAMAAGDTKAVLEELLEAADRAMLIGKRSGPGGLTSAR